MSAELISTSEWDTEDQQRFLSLGLGRDEISLYEFSPHNNTGKRVSNIDTEDIVTCLDYNPIHEGVVGYGMINGSVNVKNGFNNQLFFQLDSEDHSKCTSLSFNSHGYIGCCLDKAKGSHLVQIYDVESSNPKPLLSFPIQDSVNCSQFVPDSPASLLFGTNKSIKEYDVRSNELKYSVPYTKTRNLKINQVNTNLIASYGDRGALTLWDRRMMSSTRDPLIQLPRVFHDDAESNSFCFRFSPYELTSFSVLYHGSSIRRYQLAKTAPEHEMKAGFESSGDTNSTRSLPGDYSLFTDKVFDVETEYDRVVSFDYSTDKSNEDLEFVCLRQSGSIFKMKVCQPLSGIYFDPFNQFRMAESSSQLLVETTGENHDNVRSTNMEKEEAPVFKETPSDNELYENFEELSLDSFDGTDSEAGSDESVTTSMHDADKIELHQLLNNDITSLMQHRAKLGYSLNSAHNLHILHDERLKSTFSTSLLLAWRWIEYQQNFGEDDNMFMKTPELDLSFAGISCIWQGLDDSCVERRVTNSKYLQDDKLLENAIKYAVKSTRRDVYISIEDNMNLRRRLCLRLCGWGFGLQELESEILNLEAQGKFEKAAGWAVFHNNVARAVECLAKSRKKSHRLMSTAIAAYHVYKDVPTNNVWREQCRKLASEISTPYLRAIFAYISDGSWLDVIDDASLPLPERIGIAMRFLPQKEVTTFLSTLKKRAIANGDLEGVMLTGLTPNVLDLLQAYVDRTGDVQTAALLISYGFPRYLEGEQPYYWCSEYRKLLNSWQFFAQRARMDIAIRKVSGVQDKVMSNQAFLRCNTCHKVISTTNTVTVETPRLSRQQSGFLNKCPHCHNLLPPCGICSLPLGPCMDDHNDSDKWPIFCLNCNHGYHAVHAKEWFEKYSICPIPQCRCLCGTTYIN